MTSPNQPSPPRKKRPNWRRILLGLLLILLVAGAAGYVLICSTPRWYQPISPDEPNVDEYAAAAQARFLELHNVVARLPLGPQTWTITQDEINAFLAATYRDFSTESRRFAAPPISGPMLLFTPDTITFVARTPKLPSRNPAGGVISVGFNVRTVPPTAPAGGASARPMGLIAMRSVWLGALPLPPALVRSRAEQLSLALDPAIRQAIQSYVGPRAAAVEAPQVISIVNHALRGEPFPLTFISGRHTFMIKEVRVTNGQFTLTLAPV